MRKLVTAALLFASVTVQGQSLDSDGIAEIDDYLSQAIATTRIPGLVALVVNKDGIIYQEAFGLMDTANNKAMTTDAIFRMASMTKPVTSTAIMMLVEEGIISLDDPASRWLPDLADAQVFVSYGFDNGRHVSESATNAMTVRHLLTHTSGLAYTFTSDILNHALGNTPGGRATSVPLLFEPGTAWHYGESTRVLGEIVEAASGQELFAFMQQRILGPLGMDDTSYDIPAAKNSRVVTVHRSDGSRLIEAPNPAGEISSPHQGDGGLSGTASDYAQFIRLFLNEGSVDDSGQLLQPQTIALMGQNHMGDVRVSLMNSTNPLTSEDFPLGAGVDTFALGFQRTEAQLQDMRSVGSLAWAGIFNTEFWIDPERGIGAVLMMQLLPFYDDEAIAVLQGFEQRVYRNLED